MSTKNCNLRCFDLQKRRRPNDHLRADLRLVKSEVHPPVTANSNLLGVLPEGGTTSAGMGVTVVGVWIVWKTFAAVLPGESSIDQLQALVSPTDFLRRGLTPTILTGDLAANGVEIAAASVPMTSCRSWIAGRLDPGCAYDYRTHGGYSLNNSQLPISGCANRHGRTCAGALAAARAAYGCCSYCLRRCDADAAVVLRAMQTTVRSNIRHGEISETMICAEDMILKDGKQDLKTQSGCCLLAASGPSRPTAAAISRHSA